MAEQKGVAKRHIQRLQRKLADLDKREAWAQERHGDRVAGSIRSSDWRDAEALRAVLAHLSDGVSRPNDETEGSK